MKTWNDYPVILSVPQASALLDISTGTIAAKCKAGELPATKIGRSWSIDRDRLRAMFATKYKATIGLTEHLEEIELALSTRAAVHKGDLIEHALVAAAETVRRALTRSKAIDKEVSMK